MKKLYFFLLIFWGASCLEINNAKDKNEYGMNQELATKIDLEIKGLEKALKDVIKKKNNMTLGQKKKLLYFIKKSFSKMRNMLSHIALKGDDIRTEWSFASTLFDDLFIIMHVVTKEYSIKDKRVNEIYKTLVKWTNHVVDEWRYYDLWRNEITQKQDLEETIPTDKNIS